MKTLTQVRIQFVNDHAAEFFARLIDRVETQQITPAEAAAYRTRMERAHLIANAQHMMQEIEPGVWDVWSTGKDMSKVWTVNGKCNCPDAGTASGGKAPQGHCKHRLAVWLRRSAEKDLNVLEARMEGLKIPHTHTYECGHEAPQSCWGRECTCTQEERLCASCAPLPAHEEGDVEPGSLTNLASLEPPAQYEVPPVLTPKLAPLPEAPASLNLKFKKGQCEFMVTMRAHTDQEILNRLPAMLKGLHDQLGITFTHE
jgi:hypothetical protein